MIKVDNMQQAIAKAIADNPNLSRYRLAKELNLSTASHINNYLTGTTRKARTEVMRALFNKFGILVAAYEEDPEYKAKVNTVKEIKV